MNTEPILNKQYKLKLDDDVFITARYAGYRDELYRFRMGDNEYGLTCLENVCEIEDDVTIDLDKINVAERVKVRFNGKIQHAIVTAVMWNYSLNSVKRLNLEVII